MQASNNNKPLRERPNLDQQYGAIGISAVAAAVRYGHDPKDRDAAHVVSQPKDERADIAA
jgi:hypothetical protein